MKTALWHGKRNIKQW